MRAQLMQFPFIAYCATQYTDKTLILRKAMNKKEYASKIIRASLKNVCIFTF